MTTSGSETAIEATTNTNNQAPNSVFPVGSEVEVSSDEEGFKGAWFRATVIDARKRKKVLVEYYSLVTEDGSEQLREYVEWAHVRPLPPAVGCLSFDVGDVVDADYRDGWWTGVVKKSLGNSKFRVFFDNPPDLIEFHQNQMRVHQDWLNGHWVRPKREPQMTGSHFSPGTDVEVNLDSEEESCSAWIPAIVVKQNKDNTFLVKYYNPKPKHWGITVDFLHIRPPAPRYADRVYKLGENVDAFCDSAWRPAEITKILYDKTYSVTFKNTMKSKELSLAEIRPRVEWRGGKWEIESKEAPATPNSNLQENMDPGLNNSKNAETVSQPESLGAVGDKLEKKTRQPTNTGNKLLDRSTDPNGELVSSVLTSSVDTTTPVTSNPCVRRMRRSKKIQDQVSTESPAADTPSQAETENLSALATEARTRTALSTRTRKPAVPFTLDSFTEKKVRSKRLKNGAVEVPETYAVKRKGRRKKDTIGSSDTSAVGKAQNGMTNPVEKKDIKDESELPNSIAPSTEGINCMLAKVPSQFLDEELQTLTIDTTKNSNDVAEHDSVVVSAQLASDPVLADLLHSLVLFPNMEFEQPQTGGIVRKRKRGRPRKLVVLGLEASDEAKEKQNGSGCVLEMAQKACPANEDVLAIKVVETADLLEVYRRKKADVSTGKSVTSGTGTSSPRQSNSIDEDDRPLSTWFGAMQSQPGTESRSHGKSTLESLSKTADQRSGYKEQATAKESQAIKTSNGSAPEETQSLPFTKASPVWKVVESMDVFRELPQNPHFQPLYKCKEECREGLAIGSMVTFSSLFDKIAELQFDDSSSILNSILESLVDLEKHGFDVSAMRSRVNRLLSIKDKQEQVHIELKDSETKIEEYKGDKTKLTEEFTDVAKKISELQEKSNLIKVQIEIKDIEIAKLQKNLDAANQSISNALLDFEKLRATPMKST